jgi:hypothetical protein
MGPPPLERRRGRTAAALALWAVVAAAFSGCTVASGWSDLQGGRAPGGVAPGKDASTASDARADAVVDPGLQGATCGATICPLAEGCCVSTADEGLRCTMRDVCVDAGDRFLACTSPASCPSTAPVCCFDATDDVASCAAGCGTRQAALCLPTDPQPCAKGLTCAPIPAVAGMSICQ